ncbi:MAG: alpha amylase C-terminal domain-containing protein [Blautia sp.]|nr:alpha amylase C-terminal domain-containing protein [Blautia sp.]
MYRKYPALYAGDCDYRSFEWINADDADRSIFSFVRYAPVVAEDSAEDAKAEEKPVKVEKAEKTEKIEKSEKLDKAAKALAKAEKKRKKANKPVNLLFICNFTPVPRPDYRVGVPALKNYTQIMDENGLLESKQKFKAVASECDNHPYSFDFPLDAYGIAVFTF